MSVDWLDREEWFARGAASSSTRPVVRAASFAPVTPSTLSALPTPPVRSPDEEAHAGDVDRWYLSLDGTLAHLTSYLPSSIDGADLVAFYEDEAPPLAKFVDALRGLPKELVRNVSALSAGGPPDGAFALRYVDAQGFSCPLCVLPTMDEAKSVLSAVRGLGGTRRMYVGAPDRKDCAWVGVRVDERKLVLRYPDRVAALKLAAQMSERDKCVIVVAPEDKATATTERYRFDGGILVETPERLPGGDA